jgi:hypothetical protein
MAGIAALHVPAVFFYAIGDSLMRSPAGRLAYWAAVGLGYAAMAAVALGRRRTLGGVSGRAAFDAWLIALPPAALATAALVGARWPIRLGGWNAHGMGADGGEVNALFLPWLHLAAWWGAAAAWRRWSGRAP